MGQPSRKANLSLVGSWKQFVLHIVWSETGTLPVLCVRSLTHKTGTLPILCVRSLTNASQRCCCENLKQKYPEGVLVWTRNHLTVNVIVLYSDTSHWRVLFTQYIHVLKIQVFLDVTLSILVSAVFPGLKDALFSPKCDLNSNCVLYAEGKYLFPNL
jgi:hypothetical protein